MTIAISIYVAEGLVYAADSTSSFFDTTATPPVLAQSFHHAHKLIQVGEYPIGLLTFGQASIGSRNLESLVAEFETSLTPYANRAAGYTVVAIANALRDFVQVRYAAQWPVPPAPLPGVPAAPDSRPGMGIVMGGYSDGQFFPDEFLIMFPAATVEATRPIGQQFGARWWGVTEPIVRLVLWFDPGIHDWFVARGIDAATATNLVAELRQRFQWNTLFDGMPLQDAIDYAVYLANVTIGHSRFVIGPPVCGGPVDVASIDHHGFSWVRQKKNLVKSDSVFF